MRILIFVFLLIFSKTAFVAPLCYEIFRTAPSGNQFEAPSNLDTEIIFRASASTLRMDLAYELMRSKVGSSLLERIQNRPDLAPGSVGGSNASPQQLLKLDQQTIEQTLALTPTEREALEEAIRQVQKQTQGTTSSPIVRELSVSRSRSNLTNPRGIHGLEIGFAAEVAKVDLKDLKWNRIDEYTESRLGPIHHILDRLKPTDRLVWTNLPLEQAIEKLPPGIRIVDLNLPVSSFAKRIALIFHPDNTQSLVFSDFQGRNYLRHFQLLARQRMERRGVRSKVFTLESREFYEKSYEILEGAFTLNRSRIGFINAIVLGYENSFKSQWLSYYSHSVASNAGWTFDIYELPEQKRVAVLSSSRSYHGEILGESVKRLVNKYPQIQSVFMGGSGGSLNVRAPYTWVYPSEILGPAQGGIHSNVLSSHLDRIRHESVLSPLAETRASLNRQVRTGIGTLDMEMGYLAEALSDTKAELGVAVLATDFPLKKRISSTISLDKQASGAKEDAKKAYVQTVFNYLTRKIPHFENPLEKELRTPLAQLSERNVRQLLKEQGALSTAEKRFLERVQELDPGFTVRLSIKRLGKILVDDVILSTAAVEKIKKTSVDPMTKPVEEAMFGAMNHIFGTVGYWHGPTKYGEVAIELRPEIWKTRSWASRVSGLRSYRTTAARLGVDSSSDFIYDSRILAEAQLEFSEQVFLPHHYSEVLSYQALRYFRSADPIERTRLLSASAVELTKILGDLGFGLEGKIPNSVNIEDIQSISLPANVPSELIEKLKEQKLPYLIRIKAEPEIIPWNLRPVVKPQYQGRSLNYRDNDGLIPSPVCCRLCSAITNSNMMLSQLA